MVASSPPAPKLPRITFFHLDGCERQTVEPIAEEADRRGFPVEFTNRMEQRAEIGVYCQHACRPNADFSVIMLHDLAQRHDIWPKFWQVEPWHYFDIGLVPGKTWVERWQTQADFAVARPRIGLFDLGWPKADLVFRNRTAFAEAAATLRQQLGLRHERSVLYAPSWENDGKQDDFVQTFIDQPVNLLLKQAPWSDDYPMVLENIERMNQLHRGCSPNVHIIDRDVSIMYCLGLADVLVSDESSVLTEALLLDVPGVAVEDWLIPDRIPSRYAEVPYDHVIKTKRADLRQTVLDVLAKPEEFRQRTFAAKHDQFSHLGQSAKAIMDTIEAATGRLPLPYPPCTPNVALDRQRFLEAERMMRNGRAEEGLRTFFELANANTPCWEVFNSLGVIAHGEGNIADATLLFETAADRAPNPRTVLANLIDIHCNEGQREKALVALNEYLRHTPATDQFFRAIRSMVDALEAPPSPN